jgi:hypothetical protein
MIPPKNFREMVDAARVREQARRAAIVRTQYAPSAHKVRLQDKTVQDNTQPRIAPEICGKVGHVVSMQAFRLWKRLWTGKS